MKKTILLSFTVSLANEDLVFIMQMIAICLGDNTDISV